MTSTCTRQRSCEVPIQDYSRIQLMHLPSVLSKGKLFTDYTFPPDKSSLTYVYSGDDRYEKMVFKRPKDITSTAVFAGVGGVYETPFPWKRWRKCAWFEAAIAVVSLNIKKMDRLVPSYRNFDQSLQTDYIEKTVVFSLYLRKLLFCAGVIVCDSGCFCFKLWRFDEWIDIVVDDHLPTMGNKLLYCDSYGSPREFWGPLVEKAYAKCKKTYEANECGRTLDALTDLTGDLCEFYTPDINPPENLFHLLYKSCVNRSQMICWRNDKLLTPTGFLHDLTQEQNADEKEVDKERLNCRYLHLVTAATKFPLSDGRMVEMVRLMCPYKEEPVWNGKFAERDEISWGTVNMEFFAKYKPLCDKEPCEYWMTLEDFRCNFGGLIISSSDTPFTTEGLNLDRCYRRLSEDEIKSGQKTLFTTKDRRRSSEGKQNRQVSSAYNQNHPQSSIFHHRHKRHMFVKSAFSKADGEIRDPTETCDTGILVRENTRTVKVDNTSFLHVPRTKKLINKTTSEDSAKNHRKKRICERASSADMATKHRDGGVGGAADAHVTTLFKYDSNIQQKLDVLKSESSSGNVFKSDILFKSMTADGNSEKATRSANRAYGRQSSISANCTPDHNKHPLIDSPHTKSESCFSRRSLRRQSVEQKQGQGHGHGHGQGRSDSIVSTNSTVSECQSTFSASDITLSMQTSLSRENSFKRPKSAPGTFVRTASSGSLPNLITNTFIASSPDNFRSHGSWRFVLEYKGTWESSDSGVSSIDLKLHSRNPRITLHILHPDAVNQIVAPCYHGKSHVIVSLMQDYRHGAPTANSLLVPIGFSVYKTKNPGRDEKRSLAKLSCIGEETSDGDLREISKRFDLWPGTYFIVPYCLSDNHSGQFFVRALAEKDPLAAKTGCSIS